MSGFDWWDYCQKWRTPEALAAIGRFYSIDYFQFAKSFLCFGSGSFAGQPFELAQFQIDEIIGPLLYTTRDDFTRQYRDAGLWLPRKNGKSEFCSSVGLYELSCSKQKAEIVLAGGILEDAEIVFNCASYMAQNNAHLEARLKVTESKKTIVNRSSGSVLKAVATNKKGKHGKNPSLVIGDELHTWMYREMWTSLTTGSGARPQPLFVRITTSSDNDPECLETEEYEYAAKVKEDPAHDPEYLAVLYIADKKADNWESEKVWRRVNPGIEAGFRSIDDMRRMARKAKDNPRLRNDFCRLFLNMRLGSVTRWIDLAKWAACEVGDPIPDGSWIFGGLDLASTTDIAAWCRYDGRRRFEWDFWIPAERMREIEDRDRVPYSVWVEAGIVTATPGAVIDYEVIKAKIAEDRDRFELQFIGYDPWNGEAVRQDLEAKGIEMVQIRQGVGSMSAPSKEFERKLLGGNFDHGGNEVATWMASNVEVFTDNNGNIKPVRPKRMASGKKVDGIVAAIMALCVSLGNEPPGENLAASMGPIFLDDITGDLVD